MAEIRQFNLAKLKELINDNDDLVANNYISRNLAVARNVQLSLILNQFSSTPTMLPEMRILLVKQGWSHVTLNMIEHRIEAGDLVYLGANGTIQYHDASSDVQAIGISMSDELFQLAIGNRIPEAFDGHLRDFHLHLDRETAGYYDNLHLMLKHYTMIEGHSSQVTLHLISALLWYVNHVWSQHEQFHRKSQSREQQLFTDFMQLVSRYAPEQHAIDFYASRLCITPRYLSTIIKQVSGKSAKQWIDEALATRIKIELKHTRKPIALICDELNFPNPSFLSKFFKRMTGQTPTQFQDS